jgi:hypothetical protein
MLNNAYIGNEVLPGGKNPFVPPVPVPPYEKNVAVGWIIVLFFVGILLLAFLAYAFYKMKLAKNAAAPVPEGGTFNVDTQRGTDVVYQKIQDSQINNS